MVAVNQETEKSTSSAEFLALLPRIRRYAQLAFRNLRGDARAEAVQETLARTWGAFVRLSKCGRQHRAFASVLARFAIAQYRDGRRTGSRCNRYDVLAPCARNKSCVVERLDRFEPSQGGWTEALVEDTRTPVLDQVCFRIDFPSWLAMLSRRDRRLAKTLALGYTTNEVAQKFSISAARVSQLRRALDASWHNFQGDSENEGQIRRTVCSA